MMKYSKLMKERIRRTSILFKELGYELFDEEPIEESYSCGFLHSNSENQGVFFIEKESKFLEIAYNFTFSPHFAPFVRNRMQEIIEAAFEYGCYLNVLADENAVSFSLFSKLYFSGMNYASLRDTLQDYNRCVDSVKELVMLHYS
ncbi:MAG: hypothetical protein ACLFSA_06835 [Spirochaetaceae bacterium]